MNALYTVDVRRERAKGDDSSGLRFVLVFN